MFKQVEGLMPKAKYTEIYKDLKRKIETGKYEFQELLPLKIHWCRNMTAHAIPFAVPSGIW